MTDVISSERRLFDGTLDGFYSKPDKDGHLRWYGRALVAKEHPRRYWDLGTNEAIVRRRWR